MPKATVLTALVHETLNAAPCASLQELSDAVKARAARLRVPYDSGQIADAIRLVGRTRPMVWSPVVPGGQARRPAIVVPPVSHHDAVRLLAEMGATIRPWPGARS